MSFEYCKKSFHILFPLLFLTGTAASQVKPVVKKSYAFYTINISSLHPKGGIDEVIAIEPDKPDSVRNEDLLNLTVKDTSILIFLETTVTDIVWTAALQNKCTFKIISFLNTTAVQPGFENGGDSIIISASKGNFLFTIQLAKKGKNTPCHGQSSFKNPVVLKGMRAGKPIIIKTAPLKQLIVEPPS
jgi:hypothetical protein